MCVHRPPLTMLTGSHIYICIYIFIYIYVYIYMCIHRPPLTMLTGSPLLPMRNYTDDSGPVRVHIIYIISYLSVSVSTYMSI